MKKKSNLQIAVRVVCLQLGMQYADVAKRLRIPLKEFKTALKDKPHPKQRIIAQWTYKNLDTTYVPLKVHCELNNMTLKDYCEENGMSYSQVLNEGFKKWAI